MVAIVARSWQQHLKAYLVVIPAVLLFMATIVYAMTQAFPKTDVTIGSNTYRVRVSATPESRYQGLSGVSKLASDHGLLMAYPQDGLHGITMRGMKFDIDIVWLDSSQKVVHIVKNAAASLGETIVYTPEQSARYVLELPVGSIDRSDVMLGEKIDFTIPKGVE